MALENLLQQLDPRPEIRGRQFDRICAWYLRSAPEYRGRFRKIWLWSDWPGAWAPDAGIDLVAEENGGDLWAIQAKAYDPDYAKPLGAGLISLAARVSWSLIWAGAPALTGAFTGAQSPSEAEKPL